MRPLALALVFLAGCAADATDYRCPEGQWGCGWCETYAAVPNWTGGTHVWPIEGPYPGDCPSQSPPRCTGPETDAWARQTDANGLIVAYGLSEVEVCR